VAADQYEDAGAAMRRYDYATAHRLFRELADRGHSASQYILGHSYATGRGVPQSWPEAFKWYRKSADQGFADAQHALGIMYVKGLGVRQDQGEAARWFRRAADQGFAEAQSNLGYMYEYGLGVPQSYVEASTLYRKAAVQGGVVGQLNLAELYENGQGVPQDDLLAHMWFDLAAARMGDDRKEFRIHALNHRDLIAAKMTPAQLAQARTMSERCLRSRYKDCEAPAVVSTGTGFFVSDKGHVVTNAHVVDGCRSVRASRGGTLSKVATDDASDLAVYVAAERSPAIARLRGGRGARVGEAVVTIGFPLTGLLSSDPIVTTGIISALSGMKNDRRTIQITAPVQSGNSGGPLLGEYGSVVGVVVAKLDALKVAEAIGDMPQNVNFAVSLGTLQSFLNANDIPYLLDDAKVARSPADIAAEATRYTVMLECLR
jgi:hypothetical protein